MKVVLVDNFDRETVSDILYKENLSKEDAETIAKEYNKSHSENTPFYARVVSDDYKLYDATTIY